MCNFERRLQEEKICEIVMDMDQWFSRRCHLNIFLIRSSSGPFVQQSHIICANLVKGYYEEQLSEIILNLDQWFRRESHKKYFLSRALAAHLFSGAELFVQFW